jgi:hypothetical protein
MPSIHRPPEVRVVEVVEVRFVRGEGCCEQDRVRRVTAYFDFDGNLLAESDPEQAS